MPLFLRWAIFMRKLTWVLYLPEIDGTTKPHQERLVSLGQTPPPSLDAGPPARRTNQPPKTTAPQHPVLSVETTKLIAAHLYPRFKVGNWTHVCNTLSAMGKKNQPTGGCCATRSCSTNKLACRAVSRERRNREMVGGWFSVHAPDRGVEGMWKGLYCTWIDGIEGCGQQRKGNKNKSLIHNSSLVLRVLYVLYLAGFYDVVLWENLMCRA